MTSLPAHDNPGRMMLPGLSLSQHSSRTRNHVKRAKTIKSRRVKAKPVSPMLDSWSGIPIKPLTPLDPRAWSRFNKNGQGTGGRRFKTVEQWCQENPGILAGHLVSEPSPPLRYASCPAGRGFIKFFAMRVDDFDRRARWYSPATVYDSFNDYEQAARKAGL